MKNTIEGLFQSYYRINMYFYDHIGFRKDDFDECSLVLILNELNLFQNSLLLEKIVIIGHSIHAYIAAEYAKIFPDRVDKIVLIGSSAYVDYREADKYFEEIASKERKDALNHNLNLPLGYFSNDQFIDKMLRFAPMLWYDYNYDAKKLWEGVEFNDRAAKIIWGEMFKNYKIEKLIHPMLVIIGKYDFFNPPFLWKNTENVMLFEKSGHTPQLEESERFDMEFLKFLRKN